MNVLILGGGHAAAQLCASLAEAGLAAGVTLVSDEPHLPYQRPPLSKGFLKSADEGVQAHRPEAWYGEAGITVHLGDAAVAIDLARRQVRLRSGTALPYDWLVLATGAHARHLPGLPETLANVAVLRSADDAVRLRGLLADAPSVTVLGGGFIGLEVAATARAQGKEVTVLEGAPRLMARAVSPELSVEVQAAHEAAGTRVRTGVRVGGFEHDGARLQSLEVDGVREPVDLLVLAIGAQPRVELARAAGLVCDDGIVVDEHMRTSDERVLAVGDCTNFPDRRSGACVRLESVQNANDQARTAVATIRGEAKAHDALPWFWSDQGSLRLQMAGLLPAQVESHRRPGPGGKGFSLLHYADGAFVCVESVNAPMDHMMARKLLEAGKSPDPAQACDPAVPLKNLLAA